MYYRSGEAIEAGDYVLWHGDPATIELIADPAIDPADWFVTEYGGGVMINPPMVFIDAASLPADEDLDFVARARPTAGTAPVFSLMSSGDYDGVREIWDHTPGLKLRTADSPEAITRYLERNPSLSFVCRIGE